ncbi:MAG TPA: cupin domain-containing protein, partial [Acidimicrobiales bacterium]|nr:cupin domain-containing protein [Acidimicrobiales bacterium]
DEQGDRLDAGTVDWHRPLTHTRAAELSADTAQSPGMERREAISGARGGSSALWMGQARVAPGSRSADHHHGRSETGIYVAAGHPVFVFLEDGRERRLETAPGDYVFVPPWVPHREENPAGEEAVVVLARTTQEAIVVNLPGLDAAPEPG